jgi:acyl carrier protein
MEINVEARLRQIREIIAEHLELESGELSDTSLLVEDHAADSLSRIDILAALEKEFSVSIDQEAMERMVNVKGVYAVVAEAAGW